MRLRKLEKVSNSQAEKHSTFENCLENLRNLGERTSDHSYPSEPGRSFAQLKRKSPESNLLAFQRRLDFFLELAFSDANRARRIALADGFLVREKLEFAMQVGAARNMKDLLLCILGDCDEPCNWRRIWRTRGILMFQSEQNNAPRRVQCEAQRHCGGS